MDLFKVIYFPNSECNNLTLAKAILVFDEISFIDHPSLTFDKVGTIGHQSIMRHYAHGLAPEGYKINVLTPIDGPVTGELESLVDVDIGNTDFRKSFIKLVRNDPSFLVNMVPNGDYGPYGSADKLRELLRKAEDKDIPKTVKEINQFTPDNKGISPEVLIAMTMAQDSYKLNVSAFIAADDNSNLFGDSVGMDMLLKAKFDALATEVGIPTNASHKMAYTLLEKLIPNSAFQGKKLTDIVHFRNSMDKQREKFNEHVLEYTIELQNLSSIEQEKKFNDILYAKLLPEARQYQEAFAKSWDKFFKESVKAVVDDSKNITHIAVTMLPISHAAAIMAASAEIGLKLIPSTVKYLKDKESLKRNNPYSYLMKF